MGKIKQKIFISIENGEVCAYETIPSWKNRKNYMQNLLLALAEIDGTGLWDKDDNIVITIEPDKEKLTVLSKKEKSKSFAVLAKFESLLELLLKAVQDITTLHGIKATYPDICFSTILMMAMQAYTEVS